MDYENIFKLQQAGYSFEEAKEMDGLDIAHNDMSARMKFEQDKEDLIEYQNDLQERGFLLGTENPHLIHQIEQQEAFQDRYEMFMNEY